MGSDMPIGKKSKSGKRFEIKKWNAVAMWSWKICTDTCAIGRNNLYEPSIEYQANPTGGRQKPGALPPCIVAIVGFACWLPSYMKFLRIWLYSEGSYLTRVIDVCRLVSNAPQLSFCFRVVSKKDLTAAPT